MNAQAPFALRAHNPDVLSCIANLSNDEVFTPPEFAARMLDTLAEAWAADHDGANLWADPTVRFLDPCTKSGVFLREITSRLTDGLAEQMPDLEARVDHILTRQVFGIGLTRITALLARRSVYCSKRANGEHSIARSFTNESGNVWFERTEHTWKNGRCTYCGASQEAFDRGGDLESHAYAFLHTDDIKARIAELFGDDMQFDVIIGNPPYQLSDGGGGGGTSAIPIYNLFVESAFSLDSRYVVMITPSRWFSGGKGLDDFRKMMLNKKGISKLVDFPQLYDVFSNVKIRGGISYWMYNRDYCGECEVVTMIGDKIVGESVMRKLNAYDVLVRRNEAVEILDKVAGYFNNGVPELSLGSQVSSRKPFGLTNQRGSITGNDLKDPVLLYGNQQISYIERSSIKVNIEWIDRWKVLLVKAHGTSGREDVTILGEPIVAGPGTACTETYLVIGICDSENEAINLANYMRTRFVRFLVSLRKITQNITKDSYNFVPLLTMKISWNDNELIERYGISNNEFEFIKSVIADRAGDTGSSQFREENE
ncbi:MAG: Eco57I restriction-modification methylase domain-containing protein [Rhodothermales bacterium]|nr:Eco57I restriction-modification methylase domain-containing protein [Rhodothermales bacterium]